MIVYWLLLLPTALVAYVFGSMDSAMPHPPHPATKIFINPRPFSPGISWDQ